MIYVITGIGLLFLAIGFFVTENNAKYLLSGYNTMDEEDRKKVDIKSYIIYFRKFHLFLGVSFLTLGPLLTYLISENAGGMFLGVYPILAYIYFFRSSTKFSKGLPTQSAITAVVLALVLVFVTGLFVVGLKEDKLDFG